MRAFITSFPSRFIGRRANFLHKTNKFSANWPKVHESFNVCATYKFIVEIIKIQTHKFPGRNIKNSDVENRKKKTYKKHKVSMIF